MKKQLLLFLGLFVFLTISMHLKEWIDHPLEHLLLLPQSDAYGFGVFHPLIFTLLVYLLVSGLLFMVAAIKRFFLK
jgi:hypothetical protein